MSEPRQMTFWSLCAALALAWAPACHSVQDEPAGPSDGRDASISSAIEAASDDSDSARTGDDGGRQQTGDPQRTDAGVPSGGGSDDDPSDMDKVSSDDDPSLPSRPVPPTPEKAEPCDVSGCPSALECADNGVCITPPPACDADSDCGADEHCGLAGECLEPGGCTVAADCDMAESCRDGMCTLGSDCGQTELMIDPIIPNVLVLLDVSLSMAEPLLCPPAPAGMAGGCTGLPKIEVAGQAMAQMTTSYRDRINWGLAMFSGPAPADASDLLMLGCYPPADVIPPGPGNTDLIQSAIAPVMPSGWTPINASIASIQASGHLSDPDRPNYLLFVSDGGETCQVPVASDIPTLNEDTRERVAAMQAGGIGTFVVGFGDGVDGPSLNSFAEAGGHPNRAGVADMTGATPLYYAAEDAVGLEQALAAILGSLVGCDFEFTDPPEDSEAVWAFLDDVMVDRDTPDGWFLDEANNQVFFVGESCRRLRDREVSDIDIVFGCPEPVLE